MGGCLALTVALVPLPDAVGMPPILTTRRSILVIIVGHAPSGHEGLQTALSGQSVQVISVGQAPRGEKQLCIRPMPVVSILKVCTQRGSLP